MKKIMIKIGSFFKKIGKSLYKVLDTIIITPISKLVYKIINFFSSNNGILDKLLNKPNVIVFLSLMLAFLTFIIIDQKVVTLVETKAAVIENQRIDVEYNEESYIVEGIPEDVDIILMGRSSDLYLAQQLGEHKVTIDLSGLGVGTHKVNLKYNNPISTLDYKLDPSSVTVVIYPIVREVRTVTTDILNTDKLDQKLIVSSVTLDRDEVIIKSYAEKLETVASVKAIIDANALNASSAGTYTLDNVKLVAYDEKGAEIPDIEILPETLTATVVITSPSKTVPITIVPVGEVASGAAIESINASVTNLTIYGDQETLNGIESIEVKIDVNGLNEDKTYQTSIEKPSGVRFISDKNITIKLTMQKETSKEFENISIELQNLSDGLKAFGKTTTSVTVVVKGTSSALESLSSSDISAYVDLSDLTVGEWQVPVKVTGSDLKLTYASKTSMITILISK